MGKGLYSFFQKRPWRLALLVASWPLAYLAITLFSDILGRVEYKALDVLLVCGALLGCLFFRSVRDIRVKGFWVVSLVRILFAIVLIIGLALGILSVLAGWVLSDPGAPQTLYAGVIRVEMLIVDLWWCVPLLALLMGFLWGVLAAEWVDTASSQAGGSSSNNTLLLVLALLFGVFHALAQPLGLLTPEALPQSLLKALVCAALWGVVLWPLLAKGIATDGGRTRLRRFERYLVLLLVGGVCTCALMLLSSDVFITVGVINWVALVLACCVCCAIWVVVLRGSQAVDASQDGSGEGVSQSDAAYAEQASRFGLTAREQEVLALAVDGASSKDIGEALGIAPSTAREYLRRARLKLAEQGVDEQELFAQEAAECPQETKEDAASQDDMLVLVMSVVVALALSPFGSYLPAKYVVVAALLMGFTFGGLAAYALRSVLPCLGGPRANTVACVASYVSAFVVLTVRMLLWMLPASKLVAWLVVASCVMGLASFWAWGSNKSFASVLGKQEFLLVAWLVALGACNALLWISGARGFAYVVLAACSLVFAGGVIAGLYLVQRWLVSYAVPCFMVLSLLALVGKLSVPSAFLCCALAFVPWLIRGLRAADGEGATAYAISQLPLSFVLGSSAALVIFVLRVMDGKEAFSIAFFTLFLLLVLGLTVVFVLALDTSLAIRRSAKLTTGDNEQLLRAWLSVRGVNGMNADVALALARGESVPALAERLGYSKSAVRKARQACYRLLGVHSLVELIRVFETFIEANAEAEAQG